MKDIFSRLVRHYRIWYYTLRPMYALMLGYVLYIVISFTLLSMPICWKVPSIPLIDTTFTAVSSVTTAGLQTVNFADTYNIFGQFVILLGIQIGGLGYMTLGSLIIMASKGHLPKNRLAIGKAVLAMPESFDPQRFFRHIFVFTLSIESIGACILWFCFWSAGTPHPFWAAIFHSIGAFCTAGVSIFPYNLEPYADNSGVCLTITLIALLGGIGFIVLEDLYRSFKTKSLRTTLTTRIILVSTFGAIVVGTVLIFFDPYMATFPMKKRMLTAFFQAICALTTTGYNTIPISNLTAGTLVIVIVLMLLGASPSGTGGGLKSTTWSAAIAAIKSFLRGDEEITFFKYKVPHARITAAFASITLYTITFLIGIYCLLHLEIKSHEFEHIVFEVVAALGTTGLSCGITQDLSAPGKFVIMVLMFVGRIGVVALALGAVALYQDISRDPDDPNDPSTVIQEGDIVL